MNVEPSVGGGLDHGTLEEMSFGCVEQRVRREDLVEARWDAPLGCHHTNSVGACHGSQGTCNGIARSMRHSVDDTPRQSTFGHSMKWLTGQ